MKRHLVNIYVILAMAAFLSIDFLQRGTQLESATHDKISIMYLSFATIVVILSGIGLNRCIEKTSVWFEKFKRVDEE